MRVADQDAVGADGAGVPGEVVRARIRRIVVAGLGRQVAALEDGEGALVEVLVGVDVRSGPEGDPGGVGRIPVGADVDEAHARVEERERAGLTSFGRGE